MDTELELPQYYKDKLNSILTMLEEETGDMYQFEVRKFGIKDDAKYFVGKFTQREGKIEICDVFPSYYVGVNHDILLKLIGVYDNLKEVNDRISKLREEHDIHSFIELSNDSNDVYVRCGGSLPECHTIGKWRYV
jgi:hypothetical protein